MKPVILQQTNGMIAIESPYQADFVAAIKELPGRKWDAQGKRWLVPVESGEEVFALAHSYFDDVIDNRDGKTDVEASKLDAEIAQLKGKMTWLSERKSQIESLIDQLEAELKSYSYTSKSTVKGATAQDLGLLRNTLRNLDQPVEELVEIQVRGIQAAYNLLNARKAPRYWTDSIVRAWQAI